MSSASIKAPQPKDNEEREGLELQNESHLREDFKKDSERENENEKPQSKEVVINLDELMQNHVKTGFSNKNFLLYECRSNPEPRKKLPTTLVYFGDMAKFVPPSDNPMEYDSDRNGFVRLVMILVFIMISTTATCIAIVFVVDDLKAFCQNHGLALAITGMCITLGATYAIACSPCTRIFPCNIICLIFTVIGMTLICAFITVRFKTELVLLAVAATGGVVLVCVLISLTKFDFTSLMIYVWIISAAVMVVFLIFFIYTAVTGHYMKWVHFIILAGSTIISSVVLIIELQMILGGKAVQLSEDDYALGAFMVYTSIIDIFLKILQMLGILDSD